MKLLAADSDNETLRLLSENQGPLGIQLVPFLGAQLAFDVTNAPGPIANGASLTQLVVATGIVLATDQVMGLSSPAAVIETGLVVSAQVSADNQIALVYVNATAAPIDPGSNTFRVFVQRSP